MKYCNSMQRGYPIPKNVWQAGCIFLSALFIALSGFIGFGAGRAQAGAETPEVIYARSGDDDFSATLVSDAGSGIVPIDAGLIKVVVNGSPVPFELSGGQQGQVEISGSLPALPDGRYGAAIETYSPDNNRLDGCQALLFVDSAAPMIELVEPKESFSRTSSSLLFAVRDPENGSGIIADPDAAGLQIEIAGAEVFSKAFVLVDNELHLLVILNFPENPAPPDYRFTVKVSIADRAGNRGHYEKEIRTPVSLEPEYISLCRSKGTSIQARGGFLIYPKSTGLKLSVRESMPLSFFLYAYFGKSYIYPAIVADRQGETAPEISQLSDFFQKEIGRHI